MRIHLDHHSGEPLYRQIVEAIRFRIARGDLADGEKLPSIRGLASQLEVNMLTVNRAYEELDRAGLVVSQQGRGVFVNSSQAVLSVAKRRKHLMKLARNLAAEAANVGASPEEVLEIVTAAVEELEPVS